MRLIAARRLSRTRQESVSIEQQTERITEYAERHGHTVIQWTTDPDVTGAKPIMKRKDVGPWLTKDHLLDWDAIIGFKLDRLFRDQLDFLRFEREFCRPNGKIIISVSEGIDTSTQVGRQMANRYIEFAEYELETMRERRRNAAAQLRRDNRWNGGQPPFGKIAVRPPDGKGWILADDPEYLPVRERIVAEAREGKSLNSITAWLNAEGIPSPYDVVRIRYGKEPRGTGWKPPSVRAIAEEDGVRFPPRSRETGPRPARMLNRVAYCGLCGGLLYGKANQVRKYYYCDNTSPNRGAREKCQARSIRAEDFENEVDAYMRGQEIMHQDVVWLPGDDNSRKLAEIDKAIDALDKDAADWLQRVTELHARREQVKAEGVTPGRYAYVQTGVTVGQHWASLDANERRAYMLIQGMRITKVLGEPMQVHWPLLDLASTVWTNCPSSGQDALIEPQDRRRRARR